MPVTLWWTAKVMPWRTTDTIAQGSYSFWKFKFHDFSWLSMTKKSQIPWPFGRFLGKNTSEANMEISKNNIMPAKLYVFLHDIVESFSSMINVAIVIFWNSPTASSIVLWQIFKLRFIDGDARSTTSQIPISVTDNSNPGAVGIPHSPRPPCDMEKSTTRTNRMRKVHS